MNFSLVIDVLCIEIEVVISFSIFPGFIVNFDFLLMQYGDLFAAKLLCVDIFAFPGKPLGLYFREAPTVTSAAGLFRRQPLGGLTEARIFIAGIFSERILYSWPFLLLLCRLCCQLQI